MARGTNVVNGIKGFSKLTREDEAARTVAILELMAAGLTNEEIGEELSLSNHTVKQWIFERIVPTLGLSDDIHTSCRRAAMVALAYHKGLLVAPQRNGRENGNGDIRPV